MTATDSAKALDRTRDFLTRYVVFASPEQADAAALWVGHTWTYDQFDVAPYLAIQSPEKRSGKTRLEECLAQIVREPLRSAGASLAALFRVIQDRHPTLLLDEVDTVFNKRRDPGSEDIRGLLNNGYRRGVPFLRVVGEGKKMHVESFDVFCPKAIACIGRLPDTVQDRSIVLALKRKAPHEKVERFRFRQAEQEAIPVREWWEALANELRLAEQADVPAALDDRAADSWEPLLALADAAGGDWPACARRAAVALSGEAEIEDESLSLQVLSDIRDILTEKQVERIATITLIEALHAIEERPWAEDYRHGKPLRAEGLAYLLRPWKLRSRQMKIDGINVKGYAVEWFADAFTRYLSSPLQTLSTVYPSTVERESERESRWVEGRDPVDGGETGTDSGPPTGGPTPCNGTLSRQCHRCHQLADNMELTIDAGRFVHRIACPVVPGMTARGRPGLLTAP